MSERPWTKGPWGAAAKPSSVVGLPVMNGMGRSICNIAYGWNDDDPSPEGLANARLIAAAPDLFEALEAAQQLLQEALPVGYDTQGTGCKIAAALAKARGEQP